MIEALQNENIAMIVSIVVLFAIAGTATFIAKSFVNNCLYSKESTLSMCDRFEVHP